MKQLYDKKIICPICNKKFSTKKVKMSKLKLIKRDTDFLPYYDNETPIKYNVFVCPNCGYSAMENKFNSIKFKGKEIIKKEITPRWNKRSYGNERTIIQAITTYKLALYCGELLNYNKLNLGSICLRIAWLYRINRDDEESRFLNNALQFYKEAYDKESLNNVSMDDLTLAYLIGEISRKLGNIKDALNWFNIILTNRKVSNNVVVQRMARKQWILVKKGKC